jgi:alkylation response protein AidB-like acyl-CoA dehydrogenase
MSRSRNIDFLLTELFGVEELCKTSKFKDHDRESFRQALAAAERLANELFAPHAAEADIMEPEMRDSRVWVLPEIGKALRALAEGGFLAMGLDAECGGLQMPWVIVQACHAHFYAANTGTFAYAMLTTAGANLLAAFGTESQKARYLRPMLEGRYFGTMCLSEPDVGSSVGDLKMRADPQPDGSFRLSGAKMWISGGEHELAENIIHMVLARIAGAPAGTGGVSLFIVPRYRVGEDGATGEWNDISLAGINHKMGYRATVNTLLKFGEHGQCIGHLIGEPNQGLRQMFHMMNEARVAVGLSSTMLAYTAYECALDYARGRRQGRLPDNRDPLAPPVPIIEHADVKRLLLAQKASVEGGLALSLYCAFLVDRVATCPESERRNERLLLELLTPIAKSWPSEFCLEANKLAIQVLGGYGYSREFPVERLYRDNRLNAIHEGTHGIHGIDLLGRKVVMEEGRAFALLVKRVHQTIETARGTEQLRDFALQLGSALKRCETVTRVILECAAQGSRTLALANATVYLDMLGHLVIAWMWLWQACVAVQALPGARGPDRAFYLGKLRACRYFYFYELPKCHVQADMLVRLDDTCLSMPTEAF